MQHTEHYDLNIIETSDAFSPEALNENTRKLDGLVTQIVAGSYNGDNADTRNFDLGFKPRAVLLFREDGCTFVPYNIYGGLALRGAPLTRGSIGGPAMTVTDTGFCVYNNAYSYTNYGGTKYFYIAFR